MKCGTHEDQDREGGLGLSELVVTMFVFGIILTLVVGVFVGIGKVAATSRATVSSSSTASNAMNELGQVIRNGTTVPVKNTVTPLPAFAAAAGESVTLYSIVGGTGAMLAPVKVTFSVNASRQLIETRAVAKDVDGYWSWPSSAATTTRNLSGSLLVSTDGIPLFTYLNAAGLPLPVGAGGALAAEHLAKVAAIKVTMRVEGSSDAPGRTVELKNTIGVPNLGNVKIS